MDMLLLMMWFRVVLACLIVTSHFWFMLTSLLTQTLEFLLSFPWLWAEMSFMTLLILMCLSLSISALSSFPGVWVYLFVCVFILTMLSSLLFPFPYLLVLSHPVCPPAMPNYSTSNLIANLCPLLIDVGICQLPANWASLCWRIKVPE